MSEPCNVFKKLMKREPWNDDNSEAGGAASGKAAPGEASAVGAAATALT